MNSASTSYGATSIPFRILTVCTGNICRSPMAERLLQAGLNARFPGQFSVESAGTGALVGDPIHPTIAGFIRESGGIVDDFSARQLTPEILQGQDLVLALTRAHRSRIVEMSPVMLKRTFTLREFARLLAHLDLGTLQPGAQHWRDAMPKALRARSGPWGAEPSNDDVVDPYGRGDDSYFKMRDELRPAVVHLINLG
ncbi:arsenate reductase/protein-tyrosine-phosphatase family protein [Arthrobacter sp. MDT1-65]